MHRSTLSAPPRAPAQRIPAMRMNAAARATAQAEYEHAERSADALMAIVAQYRHALSALRRMFTVSRPRHG